jgi:hypothetical protein
MATSTIMATDLLRDFGAVIDAKLAVFAETIGAPTVNLNGWLFTKIETQPETETLADLLADFSAPGLPTRPTLAETDFLANHIGAIITTDKRGAVDVTYFADAETLAAVWDFADA